MKTCLVVVVSLLSLALLAGCYLLAGISFSEYCSIANESRETLGNYDEHLRQIKMMGIPASLVALMTMVVGPISIYKYESRSLAWVLRGYGASLLVFAGVLMKLAYQMNQTSSGQGSGLIILITGPMILFALLVPALLGAIVLVVASSQSPRSSSSSGGKGPETAAKDGA